MLQAAFHGKLNRGKRCEDTLTSSVFGLMRYLPDDIFWSILSNSAKNVNFINNESIIGIKFWPRWDTENSDNRNYVEPDVFIRGERFDVIIEAKRWDDKGQKKSQLESERKAYENIYKEEDKSVYIITVGGNKNLRLTKDGLINKHNVIQVYWRDILDSVIKIQNQNSDTKDNLLSLDNILSDLIKSFEFHGFFVGVWLESLSVKRYRLKNYTDDIRSIDKIFTL